MRTFEQKQTKHLARQIDDGWKREERVVIKSNSLFGLDTPSQHSES